MTQEKSIFIYQRNEKGRHGHVNRIFFSFRHFLYDIELIIKIKKRYLCIGH